MARLKKKKAPEGYRWKTVTVPSTRPGSFTTKKVLVPIEGAMAVDQQGKPLSDKELKRRIAGQEAQDWQETVTSALGPWPGRATTPRPSPPSWEGSAAFADQDIGMGGGGRFVGLGDPRKLRGRRAGPDLPPAIPQNIANIPTAIAVDQQGQQLSDEELQRRIEGQNRKTERKGVIRNLLDAIIPAAEADKDTTGKLPFRDAPYPSMAVDWTKVRASQRPGYEKDVSPYDFTGKKGGGQKVPGKLDLGLPENFQEILDEQARTGFQELGPILKTVSPSKAREIVEDSDIIESHILPEPPGFKELREREEANVAASNITQLRPETSYPPVEVAAGVAADRRLYDLAKKRNLVSTPLLSEQDRYEAEQRRQGRQFRALEPEEANIANQKLQVEKQARKQARYTPWPGQSTLGAPTPEVGEPTFEQREAEFSKSPYTPSKAGTGEPTNNVGGGTATSDQMSTAEKYWGERFLRDPKARYEKNKEFYASLYRKVAILNAVAALTGNESQAEQYAEYAIAQHEAGIQFDEDMRLHNIQKSVYFPNGKFDPPKNGEDAWNRALYAGGDAKDAKDIYGYSPKKEEKKQWWRPGKDNKPEFKQMVKGEVPADDGKGQWRQDSVDTTTTTKSNIQKVIEYKDSIKAELTQARLDKASPEKIQAIQQKLKALDSYLVKGPTPESESDLWTRLEGVYSRYFKSPGGGLKGLRRPGQTVGGRPPFREWLLDTGPDGGAFLVEAHNIDLSKYPEFFPSEGDIGEPVAVFNSVEEAQAALARGDIKDTDTITVIKNGRKITRKLG